MVQVAILITQAEHECRTACLPVTPMTAQSGARWRVTLTNS
jgi:hypothetical protein